MLSRLVMRHLLEVCGVSIVIAVVFGAREESSNGATDSLSVKWIVNSWKRLHGKGGFLTLDESWTISRHKRDVVSVPLVDSPTLWQTAAPESVATAKSVTNKSVTKSFVPEDPIGKDDYHHGDNGETSFVDAHGSTIPPTILSESCNKHCGNGSREGCDCDVKCFVYKSCCIDVDLFCPRIRQEAAARFEHKLIVESEDRVVICDDRSTKYLVSGCKRNNSNNSSNLNVSRYDKKLNSLLLTYLLEYIPVYDALTGILYKDFHSFQCFQDANNSQPRFWSIEAGAYDLVNEGEIGDLLLSLSMSQYISKPTSREYSGRKCIGSLKSDIFPFSIIVDVVSTSSLEIVFQSEDTSWIAKSYCSKGLNEICITGEKGCDQYTNVFQGSCPRRWVAVLQMTHPPWLLTITDLEDAAGLIECGAKNIDEPVDLVVDTISHDVSMRNFTSGFNVSSVESTQKYFEIVLNLTSSLKRDVIVLYLKELISYAYECLGLVSGHEYLQYIPQDKNIPSREFTIIPVVSNSSAKLINCSVVTHKHWTQMNDSISPVNTNGATYYVSACVDLYLIQASGENNSSKHRFCERRLRKSKRPQFKECIANERREQSNEVVSSPYLSRALIVVVCKIIVLLT